MQTYGESMTAEVICGLIQKQKDILENKFGVKVLGFNRDNE